jgi:hypothetical protein
MWSHYSSHHQGFVLEFETSFEPFNKLQRVNYVDKMPRFELSDFVRNQNHDKLRQLFCTKSLDWAYEKEWRLLHEKGDSLYAYDRKALKSIYFGPRMSEESKDLLCCVCDSQFPETELWVGSRSTSRFAVEFEKIHE